MISRLRIAALALLALAVPLPALAVQQGAVDPTVPSGPVSISVDASLASCGVVETQVVCRFNVSYGAVPGATSYSVSVTAPNGSVMDFGAAGAGGTSVWVPYGGDGTYMVQVSAYGQPADPGGEPPVVGRSQPSAGGDGEAARVTGDDDERGIALEQAGRQPAAEPPETPAEPPAEPPVEPPVEPPAPEPEPCVETPPAPQPPAPADPAAPAEDASAPSGTALAGVSDEAAAELSEQAALPDSVDCPAP